MSEYLLVRCDKPVISFCVISIKAVHFDPENLDLDEGSDIQFDFPEDDEPGKRKRGRRPAKKTYKGTIVKKSSLFFLVFFSYGCAIFFIFVIEKHKILPVDLDEMLEEMEKMVRLRNENQDGIRSKDAAEKTIQPSKKAGDGKKSNFSV